MVHVITIRTAGDMLKASKSLKRMRTKLPKMEREAMRKWGNILERDTKSSATQAGITQSTGDLQSTGIKYKQAKKGNIGRLFIKQYGIYLDSMRPHWVNIRRDRSQLLRWGLRARSPAIRAASYAIRSGKESNYGIFVMPHPYIRSGYARARPKLNRLVRQFTENGLTQSLGGKNV